MNKKTGGGLLTLTLALCILFLVATSRRSEAETAPPPPAPASDPVATRKAEIAAIEKKLDTIKLPKLEFREAPLRLVLEWISDKSREIDPKQNGGEGVAIALEHSALARANSDALQAFVSDAPAPAASVPAVLPPTVPVPPTVPTPAQTKTTVDADGPPITLNLKDVPLRDALRYVTDIASLKFVVKAWGVLVVPANYADPADFVTKTYKIHPDSIRSLLSTLSEFSTTSSAVPSKKPTPTQPITSELLKECFRSFGICFPPESSIIYTEPLSSLVITNSRENIECFENIMEIRTVNIIPTQVELSFACVALPMREIEELARKTDAVTLNQDVIRKAWSSGKGRLVSTFKFVTISGTETRSENVHSPDLPATNSIRKLSAPPSAASVDPISQTNKSTAAETTPTVSQTTVGGKPQPGGTSFNVTAQVGADGYTLSLAIDALFSGNELTSLGGTPHPVSVKSPSPDSTVDGRRIVTKLTYWDHETQLIGSFPNTAGTETVCVFLTATLIDPSGKPVHSKELLEQHRQDR